MHISFDCMQLKGSVILSTSLWRLQSIINMEDLLATPQARAGPTSRLLRRQSQGGGALGRPAAPRTPTHALNASMKLLDDALGSPIPPAEHYITEDVTRMMEVTRPVDSTRLATRGDHTMRSMRGDFTMAVDVTRPLETSAMLGEENPGVAATENLFQVPMKIFGMEKTS